MSDMYICIEFYAPSSLVTPRRLSLAWAILHLLHPLLAARIDIPPPSSQSSPPDYTQARFVYDPPPSPRHARREAERSLRIVRGARGTGEALVDAYVNGPRTLATDRLAALWIGEPSVEHQYDFQRGGGVGAGATSELLHPRQPGDEGEGDAQSAGRGGSSQGTRRKYVMFMAATHSLTDGIGIFTLGDHFFQLVGGQRASSSPSSVDTDTDADAGANAGVARTEDELETLLRAEWALRFGPGAPEGVREPGSQQAAAAVSSSLFGSRKRKNEAEKAVESLPPSLEARIKPFENAQAEAEGWRDYEADQRRIIGAHTFPRAKADPTQPRKRHNVIHDIAWPPAQSRAIIDACKQHGVSVQNALFAACNVAWARIMARQGREPSSSSPSSTKGTGANTGVGAEELMLMYTALNLRPAVPARNPRANPAVPPSPAFVALGYFNVMLPADTRSVADAGGMPVRVARGGEAGALGAQDVVPANGASTPSPSEVFWSRAISAKQQGKQAAKHPNLLSRNLLMGVDRSRRAVRFAREDDGYGPEPVVAPSSPQRAQAQAPQSPPQQPSIALMGLSLMGNYDPLYDTSVYPSLSLGLTRCGTRKGYGGLLLFSWTLAGVLYVSLGWDEHAFPRGVLEAFLAEVRDVMAEFMQGGGRGVDVTHVNFVAPARL